MTTQEKFNAFHAKHPHVYDLFEKYTLAEVEAGHKQIGSKAIFEQIRWRENFTNSDGNKPFKLSNIYTPYYSRLFAEKHPNLASIFVYKALKS